jgi:hypothetical protein
MRLTKPLIVLGATALMLASVATAGAATRQQDRQKLQDGTCTTVVAKGGAQSGVNARDRQQLKDGTCLTTVAYRKGARSGAQAGNGTQDHKRLHDGTCLTA